MGIGIRGDGERRDPVETAASPAAAPVDRRFMATYALAQVGAFVAFLPLLGVMLPLKAQALDPGGRAVLLSQAALWGALAAAVGNLLAGLFSDASQTRFGRRRPWILFGAVATAATYGLMYWAPGPNTLIAAVVVFQLALNCMFGPLNAILADQVPDRQKGFVSALMGLGHPAASLFTAVVISLTLKDQGARFLLTAVVLVGLIAPFALGLKEPPAPRSRPRFDILTLGPLADRDFRIAFLSRSLMQVTITFNTIYLLFFLQEDQAIRARFPDVSAEAVFGWLLIASTTASLVVGFAGGLLSDRFSRRKPFVIFGGLLMAAGAATLVAAPPWPGPLIAQILFGAGLGLYSTVDIALVAQILPRREDAGRDLGLMNLAITLPQVAAPMLGIALVSAGRGLASVFVASAVCALAGALAVGAIRKTR